MASELVGIQLEEELSMCINVDHFEIKELGLQELQESTKSAFKTINSQFKFLTVELKKMTMAIMKDLKDEIVKIVENMTKIAENSKELELRTKQTDMKVAELECKIDDKLIKLAENNKELELKIKQIEDKLADMKFENQGLEHEMILAQCKFMEFAIRLRGVGEETSENLKQKCAVSLALYLNIPPKQVFDRIDKIYRVNSWIARQKQLPRDVVIYFTDKRLRNDILQMSYNNVFQMGAKQIRIYKEYPSKVIRNRKDFGFLINELKNRNIPYRWNIPNGIFLRHGGRQYRLNTIQKAKDFYHDTFMLGKMAFNPPTSMEKIEPQREEEEKMKQLVIQKKMGLNGTEAAGSELQAQDQQIDNTEATQETLSQKQPTAVKEQNVTRFAAAGRKKRKGKKRN